MFKINHRYTDEEIRQHVMDVCDCSNKPEDPNDNILWCPTISDYDMVRELVDYFLGKDYYIEGSYCNEQANAILLLTIEQKYKNVAPGGSYRIKKEKVSN